MRKYAISGKVLIVILSFLLVLTLHTNPILADVPHDITVEPWNSGTHTILNITITHNSPASDHYVDLVQINISGAIHDIHLNSQPSVTFVVEFDMGEVTDISTIKARAHCTVHGWSDWYLEGQIIPAADNTWLYVSIAVVTVVVVITVGILMLRRKRN
jgi:desulfoferrodoxin (superoxide reductase-like protein)